MFLRRWWRWLLDQDISAAGWYNARRRKIDIDLLWPACKQAAGDDLEKAHTAFKSHCCLDDAWSSLHMDEIERIVDGLE